MYVCVAVMGLIFFWFIADKYDVTATNQANEAIKKSLTNSSNDSDNVIAINSVCESLSYGSLLTK